MKELGSLFIHHPDELTATSRVSFCPLFSVDKALRIGGKESVSNFTSHKQGVSQIIFANA